MSCQLIAIIDAVAAMSVSPITRVLRGTTLKNSIASADVPVRIISAVGMRSQGMKPMSMTSSPLLTALWSVTDLALIRPAGLGMGLRDVAFGMEQYMATYTDVMRGLRSTTWSLDDTQFASRVVEWPAQSGTYFDAVVVTHVIKEIVQ